MGALSVHDCGALITQPSQSSARCCRLHKLHPTVRPACSRSCANAFSVLLREDRSAEGEREERGEVVVAECSREAEQTPRSSRADGLPQLCRLWYTPPLSQAPRAQTGGAYATGANHAKVSTLYAVLAELFVSGG